MITGIKPANYFFTDQFFFRMIYNFERRSYEKVLYFGVFNVLLLFYHLRWSDVTGTYSAPAGEDTGTVVGNVDGNEFQTTVTSLPYMCDTYMKFTIQDSLHMSGYYRGYETCEDTGSVSLVKQ
jgi:hypothetical protein